VIGSIAKHENHLRQKSNPLTVAATVRDAGPVTGPVTGPVM